MAASLPFDPSLTKSNSYLGKRLRTKHPDVATPKFIERTEASRFDWQKRAKYSQWWEDAEETLVTLGFATREAIHNPDGSVFSMVRLLPHQNLTDIYNVFWIPRLQLNIPEPIRRRIFNLDETQIPLDAGKRGKQQVLINPSVPNLPWDAFSQYFLIFAHSESLSVSFLTPFVTAPSVVLKEVT